MQYDQCVFLIFNYQSLIQLSDEEMILFEGIINKWKKFQNDPLCERINFIFAHPNDFKTGNNRSWTLKSLRDIKYSPLTQLTSQSHLYLIGHHDINDNRLEITDEGLNEEGKLNHSFEIVDIANLLQEYLTDASIKMHRKTITFPIENALSVRKLVISVAMCNTALGLLKNGERNVENSFSFQLAHLMYNGYPNTFIDCVVSGSKEWVYPIPGEPNFLKLINYFFGSEETIKNDLSYRTTAHKRYAMNLTLFGKIYETPLLLHQKGGISKVYFFAALNNNIDSYRETKVNIQPLEGAEWYAHWQAKQQSMKQLRQ